MSQGTLKPAVEKVQEHLAHNFDLIVIGGGSGGLACSKEAAKLGARVAVLDFVQPSPQGTTWGLGGTCVNVGCIPKKLMHQAALLGEAMGDAESFGWEYQGKKHNWETMVSNVQMHIKSLNFGYRTQLRSEGVKYINAFGTFVDEHTVACTDKKGKVTNITADKFVVAVGGRPIIPDDVPGAKEHALTSDDLFSMDKPPGKTLVVGASYIALECGGFLTHLGYETTVMVRSIFLRGFDQEIAEKIGGYMEEHGTNIIRPATPSSIEKTAEGRLKVTWKYKDAEGTVGEDVFDTVLFATGRTACTPALGLDKLGVMMNPSNGKLAAVEEQTNVPHIYAIGDVLDLRQELTPVAIQAGTLLARRIYGGGTIGMDYNLVPTTVFTPLEYGCNGYSEEDAAKEFGENNIEVYHSNFKPLEWTVPHRPDNACFCKLICNKLDNERVVGMHILGPNAGEITQGFALGMKLGATKFDLDNLVGIHPTTAEEFTTLKVTKASGEDATKSGC